MWWKLRNLVSKVIRNSARSLYKANNTGDGEIKSVLTEEIFHTMFSHKMKP